MGVKIRSGGRFYVDGSNGQPANGWKVYTFTAGSAGVAGTDDKETFTDYTLGTAHINPVILDARGEKEIWWDGTYLIKIFDASDNPIYTLDFYGSGEDPEFDTSIPPLNGSFETDTNGDGVPDAYTVTEYTNGMVAIDDTDAIHGLKSVKFTGTDANGGGELKSDKFAITPNEYRILYFDYKSSAVNTKNSIDVKWYNLAGSLLSTTNLWTEAAANSLSWAKITKGISTPANAVQAEIIAIGMDPTGTTTIGNTKFDSMRFERSVIEQESVASAVNHLKVSSAATGNAPTIASEGEVDTGFNLIDSNGNELAVLNSVASAINHVSINNSATVPSMQPEGDDTNINLDINGKGTGDLRTKGQRVHGMVLFEEGQLLFTSVSTTSITTWTQVDLSAFSDNALEAFNAGAVALMLRAYVSAINNTVNSEGFARLYASSDNTGSVSLTLNARAMALAVKDTADTDDGRDVQINSFIQPVNSDVDFYWQTEIFGCSAVVVQVYLQGYFV